MTSTVAVAEAKLQHSLHMSCLNNVTNTGLCQHRSWHSKEYCWSNSTQITVQLVQSFLHQDLQEVWIGLHIPPFKTVQTSEDTLRMHSIYLKEDQGGKSILKCSQIKINQTLQVTTRSALIRSLTRGGLVSSTGYYWFVPSALSLFHHCHCLQVLTATDLSSYLHF